MNFSGALRLNKAGWLIICIIVILIIYFRVGFRTNEEPELINLKSLLTLAIEAAERGGEKVTQWKNKDLHIQSKGKTKEGANDLVTDADFASHCAIYETLTKKLPNVVVISEEGSNQRTCPDDETLQNPHNVDDFPYIFDEYVYPEDITIWIDPLDATQEYTEDLTEYVTTMVCVAVKGVPVIGVIHKPFTKKTSWAWFMKAVSKDLQTLEVPMKNGPTIIVSRSHKGDAERFAKEAFGSTAKVITAGGAGYKVLELGHYNADLYLHTTAIKKWDICAGNAIIKALNGKMTTLNNKNIDYSKESDVKNNDGLMASVVSHDYYMKKIKAAKNLKT